MTVMKVLMFLVLAVCFYVATSGLPGASATLFTLPWLGGLGAFSIRGVVAFFVLAAGFGK